MNQPEASSQDQTLSREVSVFLVQFSIGLHKTATYPPNHPVVREATESVYTQLQALLSERQMLAMGVARDQLIVEGVATDPQSAVLAELAGRLHRHQVAAIRFQTGATLDELADVLATLCPEANREELPFGLKSSEEIDRWQHIQVIPLTFDDLILADDDTVREERPGHSQLWLGLAAAALRRDVAIDPDAADLNPSQIAEAIRGHKGDRTYDQVIVGYLTQLGRELKLREGAEAKALQEQIAGLVRELDQSTLTRLLGVGGGLTQRGQLLSDMSATLPVDAVMDLIKAAESTGEQTISHSFLRLLTKLADHADPGATTTRTPHADENFRESIRALLADWSLEDPNPEAYTELLDRLAAGGADEASATASETASEAPRIIQMGMEVSVFGTTVAHAVDDLLHSGRLQELLEIIDAAPEGSTGPADTWSHLSSPEQVRYLLAHDEHDIEGVQRVLERLGIEAAEPLLDALATATSRAMRHRLLSTLTTMGSDVGPMAAARLPDAEWFVKRNLLILLGSLPEWPTDFSPEPYARADDARVRREAVKLMLQAEAAQVRGEGILIGVADDDASIVRMALTAATAACPPKAERQVLKLLQHDDGDIRVLATRVLACFTTSRARAALLDRALAKRKWWQRRRRLAVASPQVLAALGALSKTWADSPAVQRVLDSARNSPHEEIRAMVTTA
ncbi:MAG: hypothetical protein E2O47_00090 [Gemmatimonadetes bacterium]|nr:MAG: hypothetical protein E2O47_00090 [Gemmatimonadota bacterium]